MSVPERARTPNDDVPGTRPRRGRQHDRVRQRKSAEGVATGRGIRDGRAWALRQEEVRVPESVTDRAEHAWVGRAGARLWQVAASKVRV